MQDFSSSSAGHPSGVGAVAETGRRLWYQLLALGLIGAFSFSVLVSQLVGARDGMRAVQAERDQAVSELGTAKRQLQALGGELAAAKAFQADQINATDKDARRLEAEVSALKAQRAGLTGQVDQLVRQQQEAEHRLATVTQRRDEVETQLAALREALANARAESKPKRHKARKPAPTAEETP